MKAFLRSVARRMAAWPYVGRLVRIGVAVIRLPETRQEMLALRDAAARSHALRAADRLDELERSRDLFPREQLQGLIQTVAELDRSHNAFATQQLPNLLESISELNHRQVTRSKELENFVRSVPVALRNTARDIVALRARLEESRAHHASAVARLDAGQAQVESLAPQMQSAQVQLDGVAQSVEYLLGRVEFVRRELMFEMRYGGSTPGSGNEQLEAKTEILDQPKLDAARMTGIRLNLGCGHIPLDGYLNVDRRALPGVDIVAEVDGLPFDNGEVDEIFSAHLLEHFPQEQLRRELLTYWAGLIKPGGEFGAVCPDADGMMKAYTTKEYDFEQLRQVTFGGQDYDGDFHYNMLTPDSLSALLVEAGFGDVRVIAANRENGGCKEFELRARRL